jgi:uncharacterized protein (TIGR03067 family)
MLAQRAVPLFLIVLISQVSGQEAKKELDQLQGEWTMLSREANGKASANTNWKLTIKGDQWKVTRPNDDMAGVGPEVTIKLDPSKNPKELDLNDRPGIYKLEGDTLTFCRPNGANAGRPKEFNSVGPNEIIVWKRAMKK